MARHFNLDSGELYAKIGVLTQETLPRNDQTYMTSVDLPSPSRKVRPLLPFEKQLPRLPLQTVGDAHPLRFVPFNDYPPSFSKTRRVRSPRFSHCLPRGFNLGNKDLSKAPDYHPNYDAVCRNTDRTVAFQKFSGRKAAVTSLTPGPADVNLDAIRGRSPSPSFDKETSRPQHGTLPSFMVGSPHRQGLAILNAKSFQLNSYSNHDYLRLSSTFGTGWTPKPFKASPVRGRSPKLMTELQSKLAEARG